MLWLEEKIRPKAPLIKTKGFSPSLEQVKNMMEYALVWMTYINTNIHYFHHQLILNADCPIYKIR